MSSHYYGLLVPTAHHATRESRSGRISIGWWLVPSAMSYLLPILIFR